MSSRCLLLGNLLALATPCLGFGQFAVDVHATATQAVLTYTAPSSDTCMIQVSESPSLSPPVNDVNPGLFAGANQDTQRSTSLINQSQRQMVIGARTAMVAADGKLYSRALQAFTTHYYSLACSSGTATGQFVTVTPPLGETAVEPPPFDPAGFGNYAWPTIDWTDTTKLYIEPRTGIAYKRLSRPDWKGQLQDVAFLGAIDVNSAWTNAANANSGKSSVTASYAAASSDPLFLPLDPQHTNTWSQLLGYNPSVSLDDAIFRSFGSGSSTAAADRTISVCWSVDSGATCLTPEHQVVLPTSAGTGTIWPTNGVPAPLWQSWTPTPLTRDQYDGSAGTVTTNGTAVTLASSQSAAGVFGAGMKAGVKILINGQVYTIATRGNSTSLTLTSSAGVQSNPVSFVSLTAGFRIRKTTGAGSVNFAASASLAVGQILSTGLNGSTPYCSSVPQTVTRDASGAAAPARTAYLCTNNKPNVGDGVQSVVYAFFPDNGEARLISNWSMLPNPYTTRKWLLADGTVATNPDIPTMYGTPLASWGPDGVSLFARVYLSNGDIGLARITYTGNFQDFNPGYSFTTQDAFVYTNLTPVTQSKGILAQITAANIPHWFSKIYPIVNLVGLSGDNFIFVLGAIGQSGEGSEAPAFVAAVDISGTLQWVADMYSTYPIRYEGFHNMEQHAGFNGVIANKLFPGAGAYTGGPFLLGISQINSNGAWRGANQSNADTSLNTTDARACPAGLPLWLTSQQITGVGGATGNTCIQIRTQEPCSATPYSFGPGDPANETANYPCPWDPAQSMLTSLAPGDEFVDVAGALGTPYEHFRVLTKTIYSGSGASAVFEMWVQRFAGPNGGTTDIAYCVGGHPGNCTHATGWKAFMIQPLSSTVSWFWIDPKGNKLVDTQYPSNGHPDFGLGPTGGYTAVTGGGGTSSLDYTIRYDTPMVQQIGKQPDYLLKGLATFRGTNHGARNMESYISMQQTATNLPQERRWFLDFNPEQNGVGVTTGESKSAWATQSYSLVAGTSSVYKLNSGLAGTVDYKSTPFFLWAGRYTFHDISSPTPGNTISDSNLWSFCYALNAGECRSGSAQGDLYFTAPGADNDGYCYVDWYSQAFPCITVPFPNSAQMVQHDSSQADPNGVRLRKLGMGFAGPGRVYQFANVFSDPTGQWGIFVCYWCSGVRNELFALKLPPWPVEENQTVNRSDYTQTTLSFSGSTVWPNLRVKFGYAEYGNPGDFYCSPRREACVTDRQISPYAYASTETLSPVSCGTQCKVALPALSGRVIYYREERLDAAGNLQFSGPITALAIPSGKTR